MWKICYFIIIIIDTIYIALFWRSLKDALHNIEYTIGLHKKNKNKTKNNGKQDTDSKRGLEIVRCGVGGSGVICFLEEVSFELAFK